MTKSSIRVACVGEAMVELIPRELPGMASVNVAGDTLNTAIYLRRNLSDLHDVSYITMVGEDALSDKIVDYIGSQQLITTDITRHTDRNPGLYSIATTPEGERSFSYWRNQSAARCLFQTESGISFNALDNYDVVYLSGISLAILPPDVRTALLSWVSEFRSKGGVFAFDSNYRPALWESKDQACSMTEAAWKLCDIALPSVDDEQDLFGDTSENAVLARFATYSQCVGALKRSATGPVAINTNSKKNVVYKRAEKVVDTTAAGDSFSGAFIASYVEDGDIDNAMLKAHNQAAKVVGHSGAIIPA